MHKILIIITFLTIISGCGQNEKKASDPQNQVTDTICISGMVCDGCTQTIGKKLKVQDGVVSQEVIFKDSMAVITYDKSITDQEKLKAAVLETGYIVVNCGK